MYVNIHTLHQQEECEMEAREVSVTPAVLLALWLTSLSELPLYNLCNFSCSLFLLN